MEVIRRARLIILIRFLLISVFFLFYSLDSQSQSDVFQLTVRHNTKVINSVARDAMFYTMATGSGGKANEYAISIRLKYRIGYRYGQDNEISVQLVGEDVHVTGHTHYRGFDLARFFIPDLLSGYVDFESEHQKHRNSFSVSFSVVEPTDIFRIEPQFRQQLPTVQQLSTELIGYSEDAMKKLDAQTRLIDKYWATVSLIDSIYRQVQHTEADESHDVSLLFVFFDLTAKAGRLGSEVISELRIIPEKNDPGNLLEATDRITRLNTRLETITRQHIVKKTTQSINARIFADRCVSYMVRFRSLANSVNYRGSEQFYSVGRLSAHASFRGLLTDIDRTFFNGTAAQFLYNELIFKGDSLSKEGNLAHALDFLIDAKDLSESISSINPDPGLDSRVSRLKEGLLQSIILIASRSLAAGKTELAQNYIDNAVRFKSEHLNDDQTLVIEKTIDPFVKTLTDKSENLIFYKRYTEAIELNEKALRIIHNFRAIPQYWPLIRHQLKSAHTGVYMDLLQTAREYTKKNEFIQAEEFAEYAIGYRMDHLEFLEEQRGAEQLLVYLRNPNINNQTLNGLYDITTGHNSRAQEYLRRVDELAGTVGGAGHDATLDSLKILAVKNMIISSIKSVDLKIWSNELDEASVVYHDAMKMSGNFGVANDPEIRAAFRRMEEKISDRICLNDKLEYEELLFQVKRAAKQGKLDEVRKNLDRATGIVANNPECLTNTEEYTFLVQRFSKSFDFNDRYKQLYNRMYEQGFASILTEYTHLDSLYSVVSSPQDDFRPTTLAEFLQEQQNPSLSLMATGYFAERSKTMMALSYLNLYRKQGGGEKQSREIQAMLARQSARLVSLQGIHEFRSKTVDDFVENDPWYKVFRQEFAKIRKLARD